MLAEKMRVLEYELPIEIEPQEKGGYVLRCPIWSDCYAEGETIDEAVLEITAIAQSLIDLYKEEHLTLPLKLKREKTLANPPKVPVIVSS